MKSLMDCEDIQISFESFEALEGATSSSSIKEESKIEPSNECIVDIEKLLIKPEPESDLEDTYELSPSDIEKEFDKFNKEDEKVNSGKTLLENNTTIYKCQLCEKVFKVFVEYRTHKKNHFIEKRRCKICKIVCQSISKLQDHTNKHLGIKPFNCDECGKAFVSVHQVKLHKKIHNKEKTFKCTKCDKAFNNSGSLRSHQLVHMEKINEFKCKVCNKDCKDLPDFRKHMLVHGKKSEIKCGVCNRVFNSDRALETHINIHKELQFPCEFCGKIYNSMYRIKRHIKRAHIRNKCDECNQEFFDRTAFGKHKRQHKENKPAECQYCHKIFDKAKNLGEHIRLQHKEDKEKRKCPVCGKEFINNALLKNHIKTHDKNFKCPDCNRVFASRYNLELHSVTHSNIRNHKCPICEKTYRTKTALKNHVPLHSEERGFHCDQCPKSFKTNRRLYVHKLSHNTEEKYECEICQRKFRVKQYLNSHMYKHSNVKPFQCGICKKRFKHKKTYEKHMNIGKHKIVKDEMSEQEDEIYEHECEYCGENFADRDSLADHFTEFHSEENIINYIDRSDNEMEDIVKKEFIEDETITSECMY